MDAELKGVHLTHESEQMRPCIDAGVAEGLGNSEFVGLEAVHICLWMCSYNKYNITNYQAHGTLLIKSYCIAK